MILSSLLALAVSLNEPLAFRGCEDEVDAALVRAIVLVDQPSLSGPVEVVCAAGGHVDLQRGVEQRSLELAAVSVIMRPQMLALMIIDLVRDKLLPAPALLAVTPPASLPVVRSARLMQVMGGLALGFTAQSLALLGAGLALTIVGSKGNDVQMRTVGLSLAIASPFVFAGGVVTFAFWVHERRQGGGAEALASATVRF